MAKCGKAMLCLAQLTRTLDSIQLTGLGNLVDVVGEAAPHTGRDHIPCKCHDEYGNI